MLTIDELNLTCLLPPKTGAGTVVSVLEQQWGNTWQIVGETSHAIVGPLDANRCYLITVRNPFLRAVSWWWFHKVRAFVRSGPVYDACRGSFPQALAEAGDHLHPCYEWLDAAPHVEFIVRNESLASDLRSLPFMPRDLDVPRVHDSEGKYGDPWNHYDAASVRRVREQFAGDFEAFGYSLHVPE